MSGISMKSHGRAAQPIARLCRSTYSIRARKDSSLVAKALVVAVGPDRTARAQLPADCVLGALRHLAHMERRRGHDEVDVPDLNGEREDAVLLALAQGFANALTQV